MNTYRITFTGINMEPINIDFTQDDIVAFDIIFGSKYSVTNLPIVGNLDVSQIKTQALISFVNKNENFSRLANFFQDLNNFQSDINEVLLYCNDNLIHDMKNILDVSAVSSLFEEKVSRGLNLFIVEGV